MRNDVMDKPFPDNLFTDLDITPPQEQAEDFLPSLMYVMRLVAPPRDTKLILMRYKEGKTYEEIAEACQLSKQRVHALMQALIDKMTAYAPMLSNGIAKYYENLINERIASMTETIEQSADNNVRQKAYAEGYENGFNDGLANKRMNSANLDVLRDIQISTLPLSVRTFNALKRNGIRNLNDIVRVGDRSIQFVGFGKTCFHEVAKILINYGVSIDDVFPKAVAKFGRVA